jgi:hypothetical protein
MAANEASRLSSSGERSSERPAEEGTPIAKVRQVASEPGVVREQDSEARALAREKSLDDLERAADSIRPSWHGTEIEAPSSTGELPLVAGVPAALPPPAPLPSFASFPIERAPFYSADSTVRTTALLPERLAQLLNQQQLARASRPVVALLARGRARFLVLLARGRARFDQAVHFLRARPWALAALLLALVVVAYVLWPASEAAPAAAVAEKTGAARHAPPPPAPPSLPEPAAKASATGPSADEAEQAAANEPSLLPAPKKRDKRVARAPAKALPTKPQPRKASKPGLPTR